MNIAIADIKPYAKNAKKHPAKQVDKVAASIKRFGFLQPVVLDRENVVIVGHGRLEAAKKLGLTEVPAIRAENLTAAEVKAYRLADNRLNESEWDTDLVLEDLKELDLPLQELTGFEIKELEPQEIVEDEAPEPPEVPKSKLGDLYQLGDHRVLCGDATKLEDVERLMGGKKADMVFTDPPYNTGMSEKKNKGSTWLNHMFNDSFTDEEWEDLLEKSMASLFYAMGENSAGYVCLDWRRSHELVPHIKNNFKFSNLIVWDKVVHGLGSDYKYTHEFIHVVKKGQPELSTHHGEGELQDVWHVQRKVGRDEEHATKKPIALMERAIRHACPMGGVLLDIFLGSGSTLIACEQTGRKCYGMEIDPRYIDVIIKRWENLTGKEAIKLE